MPAAPIVTCSVHHRGCALSYAARGHGPPVVFVQGVGVAGSGWRPQVDMLAERYRCVSLDNRGMGASQPQGCEITVEQMAEDVRAVMDAEGLEAAHVVGHSLGGLVALHLALEHRVRVRSLALLCTFADGRIPTRLTPAMVWLGLRTRVGTRPMRRRAFLRFVMPPGAVKDGDHAEVIAAELAPLFGHDLADQPPVAMKQFSAMRRYDATPRLAELRGLPTLIVSAVHDPIAPAVAGRAIAAGIPGARFVEMPNASHGVPIHQADRVNALLLEHLAAVSPV